MKLREQSQLWRLYTSWNPLYPPRLYLLFVSAGSFFNANSSTQQETTVMQHLCSTLTLFLCVRRVARVSGQFLIVGDIQWWEGPQAGGWQWYNNIGWVRQGISTLFHSLLHREGKNRTVRKRFGRSPIAAWLKRKEASAELALCWRGVSRRRIQQTFHTVFSLFTSTWLGRINFNIQTQKILAKLTCF